MEDSSPRGAGAAAVWGVGKVSAPAGLLSQLRLPRDCLGTQDLKITQEPGHPVRNALAPSGGRLHSVPGMETGTCGPGQPQKGPTQRGRPSRPEFAAVSLPVGNESLTCTFTPGTESTCIIIIKVIYKAAPSPLKVHCK